MKKINLFNTTKQHSAEKVTCYERPISDVLNYYDMLVGELFVIVSKINQLYRNEVSGSSKDKTIEFFRKYYDISLKGKYSFNNIVSCLDKGIPVIVGADLKEIYYTKYYKNTNWPHWFLIKGYDEFTRTYMMIDNAQYPIVGLSYDDFYITHSMLKKASRSYLKAYGDYSLITIQRKNEINIYSLLMDVLRLYCTFDMTNDEIFMQKQLLNGLLEIYEQNNDETLWLANEIKKKIVNTNKYIGVIAENLTFVFKTLGYDKNYDELLSLGNEYEKVWTNYTYRIVVDITNRTCKKVEITPKIVEMASRFYDCVRSYQDMICEGSEDLIRKYQYIRKQDKSIVGGENKLKYLCEHNDNIILQENNSIKFRLGNGRIYNWWLEDNAPKVILVSKDIMEKTVLITMNIELIHGYTESDFQAGFFVRNMNGEKWLDKAYTAAVSKEKWVFSEVGKCEFTRKFNAREEYSIYIEVTDKQIEFGIYDNEKKEKMFTNEFVCFGNTEIGLFCKTWGNGGKFDVEFTNININIV